MRRGNFFAKAKKTTAVVLATAMVFGMAPTQWSVKAADDSPYVISQGRMVYASSSVVNSDPTYAIDGTRGTRWESAWGNDTEWIYVDLGKVTNFSSISLQWEGAYAKQYQIQTSNDEENWKTIYTNNNCQGGDENLNLQGSGRYYQHQ